MQIQTPRARESSNFRELFYRLVERGSGVSLKTANAALTLMMLAIPATLSAQMSVSINTSAQGTIPLGTPITWTAVVSGASSGTLEYRFRVQGVSGRFHTVVDYGPNSSLTWTTIDGEGTYQIEAAVKNTATGEQATVSIHQVFTPLITGSTPVISPSANPFVFIYSAPACAVGSRMRVEFQAGGTITQSTSAKACSAGKSMNFYLAGMLPDTEYVVQHVVEKDRAVSAGPQLTFTPGVASMTAPPFKALVAKALAPPGFLLQSLFGAPAVATDLNGNIVWSGPSDISYLTRAVTGGSFMGIGEDGTQDIAHQFFREFDLAGMPVAETNAARINEQLANLGVHSIDSFHHEARKLPNGNYLVLANSERILTDVQGPGDVDVIGDTILVLDPELNVVWTWDAFDHLNPQRMATLNETCSYPAGLACASFYLSTAANDWLHGNALQLTPDGNILYSARHQDWVIKIDYANGAGSGNILWRMGQGGDFTIISSDPSPWFSHQHDPNFEANNTTMLVFDNGNVRAAATPGIHSRGQVLQVDEQNRIVISLLNADLGVYSAAVGTAEQLPNAEYHFDAGFLFLSPTSLGAQSLEVNQNGNIDYAVQFGAFEYRSFRMPDLYTAPQDALVRSRSPILEKN